MDHLPVNSSVADFLLVYSVVATLARAWSCYRTAADNRPPSGEGSYKIRYGVALGEFGRGSGGVGRFCVPE